MTTHGMTKQRLHRIWGGMKNRCSNPKNYAYPKYGGSGIKVCDRWKSFINFKNDMNESYIKHVALHGEKNTSLDRKENDKGYSPNNCQWSTSKAQSINRKIRLRSQLRYYEIQAIKLLNKKYKVPQKELNKIFGIKDFSKVTMKGRNGD